MNNTEIFKCIKEIKGQDPHFSLLIEFEDGFSLFGGEPLTKYKGVFSKEYCNNIPSKFNLDLPEFRYFYCKIWNNKEPILYFLLLNPSTTDKEKMDPTVANCYNFTLQRANRYGGFAVVNLYALRSPRIKILNKIGLENNAKNIEFLEKLFLTNKKSHVVVAWGLNKKYDNDKKRIRKFLRGRNNIYTLRLNNQKEPEERHPSNQAWARIGSISTATLIKYQL